MTTRKATSAKTTAAKKASSTKKTTSAKSTAVKTTKAPAPQVVSIDQVRVTEEKVAQDAIDQAVAATLTKSAEPEELKRKEFIDLVVARSGMKKKDVKPVVEAMLEVLGQSLSDGREFNLPPLGKLKVQRMKENDGTQVMVAKIRLQDNSSDNNDPSEDAA